MTSLREGLTAARISEFLNGQLNSVGVNTGIPGAVIYLHTGQQLNVTGVGPIYEEFKRTGKLVNYFGGPQQATRFTEPNFENANVRFFKFDETFYKMPYDVRKSKLQQIVTTFTKAVSFKIAYKCGDTLYIINFTGIVFDPKKDFLFQKSQPQKGILLEYMYVNC